MRKIICLGLLVLSAKVFADAMPDPADEKRQIDEMAISKCFNSMGAYISPQHKVEILQELIKVLAKGKAIGPDWHYDGTSHQSKSMYSNIGNVQKDVASCAGAPRLETALYSMKGHDKFNSDLNSLNKKLVGALKDAPTGRSH